MRLRRACALAVIGAFVLTGAACSAPDHTVVGFPKKASESGSAEPSPSSPASPTPTPRPKPSPKPTPRPSPKSTLKARATAGADTPTTTKPSAPPADGVPTRGSGKFAIAGGTTDVVGTGSTLVTYRVEVETGIVWGANQAWTPDSFATEVAGVLADPLGWTASAQAPITEAKHGITNGSWSFQRVSGASFSVRVLLATPTTTDRMCATVGLDTQGIYSCRYGKTILINLRRWLKGANGFAINLAGYHTMVINHEMGHLLGFDHMRCPTAGKKAPVMAQQTISLGGCTINANPFDETGAFITGPWAAS